MRRIMPGRAEAALHRARLDEGALHRVQRPVGGLQPLDGHHLAAVEQRGGQQAGVDRLAVEQDGAGAALALAAAGLGAGQAERLAQQLRRGRRRRDRRGDGRRRSA